MYFEKYVVASKNLFVEDLEKCASSGNKTYIYGAGEGADNAERRAKHFGYEFAGRVVDSKYYTSDDIALKIDDVINNSSEPINLVIGFKGFKASQVERYGKKIGYLVNRDCFAGNYSADPNILTANYCNEHLNELVEVFENLADEKSRQVLGAYISQKISMDYQYLASVKTFPQYFENGIIEYSLGEVFLDCGAYDGDSAEAFIRSLNGMEYKRIISVEPDPYNFEKLKLRGYKNHICVNKGVADQKGELNFSTSGTSSGLSEQGDVVVEIDTIDNMFSDEPITYIKMDIEGAELAALQGGSTVIASNRPKMAICIYHKREDLWQIMKYLKSIVDGYDYYIRAYEDTATELVLYAIPQSEV